MWKIVKGSTGETVTRGYNSRHEAKKMAALLAAAGGDIYYPKYYEESDDNKTRENSGHSNVSKRRKVSRSSGNK